MRNTFKTGIYQAIIMVVFLLGGSLLNNMQAQMQASGGVSIIIDGTSNIHDWDMKSDKGQCVANYTINPSGVLTSLNTLNFNIKVETIKSEHTTMDNNAYKAMKSSKFPNISFVSTSSVIKQNGNTYTISTTGRLTISSVTKVVTLTANCTMGVDKSLKGNGAFKLKMTEYGVTPPSIMFGAIKTGDEVTIKYDFNLKG